MNRLKNEPSFIRLLRENKGVKAAVYVIILSFVVFFGLLIATWVMRYRSQRIYYGPKCVYTTLINKNEPTSHSSLELIQRNYQDIEGKFMQPEVLTFQYADANLEQQSFYVTIDVVSFPSGVPEEYPTGISDSGICVKAGGVSIYIKHYDNQISWPSAVPVVEYGMSVYLDTYVNTGSGLCASLQYTPDGDDVIGYSTYHYSSDGPNSVSTNATGTSPSFFVDFTASINKIYITPIQTDSSQYNPFEDFVKSKQFIKGSQGCAANNANCRCTDPGAKNLPSCNSPYVSGKGYMIVNPEGSNPSISYSKNCRHSTLQNLQNPISNSSTQPSGDSNPGQQNYSQMLPKGSNLSNAIQANSSNPGDFTDMNKRSKFGSKSFPNGSKLSDEYQNSFPSDFIFCGSGPSSTPVNFDSFNLYGSSGDFVPVSGNNNMRDQLRGSSVPNSTTGSPYQLGYSN
jgi:hypothetical protein